MNGERYKTDFLVAQPSFTSGLARVFDFAGTFDAYNESLSPAEADARALNNDWNVSLQDFQDAVKAAKVRMENGETR